MKTMITECIFGACDNYERIEYNGKEYRAVSLLARLNDGSTEWHVIAERQLETDLAINFGGIENISCGIDDAISYYADDDDDLRDCLQQITGENVV